MRDKIERESTSIETLARHFNAVAGENWYVERGEDPPDFILQNPSGCSVAVEHTSFIWPPREIP